VLGQVPTNGQLLDWELYTIRGDVIETLKVPSASKKSSLKTLEWWETTPSRKYKKSSIDRNTLAFPES